MGAGAFVFVRVRACVRACVRVCVYDHITEVRQHGSAGSARIRDHGARQVWRGVSVCDAQYHIIALADIHHHSTALSARQFNVQVVSLRRQRRFLSLSLSLSLSVCVCVCVCV